tara:strand:- start:12600 stop:13493 length:894 start_codon:yes stop_codon:yes gene_type:complete
MNLKRINNTYSIFLFLFSIFFSLMIEILNISPSYIFCFFLISIIGISHGALDNFKGKKLFNYYGIKNHNLFYIIYILISFTVIFFWVLFPFISLCLFLLVAAHHFGREDSSHEQIKNSKFIDFYFLLKGSAIILAPLYFHENEVLQIFNILGVVIRDFNNSLILGLLILSGLSCVLITKKFYMSILDCLTICIINYFLDPFIAFTIYFCFLHSVRHSLSLIKELDNMQFKKGFGLFLKKALPLTFITALIFIISVYLLNNIYTLDQSILKVIFIGLASLTFPHILLEYLIEKNEKRS